MWVSKSSVIDSRRSVSFPILFSASLSSTSLTPLLRASLMGWASTADGARRPLRRKLFVLTMRKADVVACSIEGLGSAGGVWDLETGRSTRQRRCDLVEHLQQRRPKVEGQFTDVG